MIEIEKCIDTSKRVCVYMLLCIHFLFRKYIQLLFSFGESVANGKCVLANRKIGEANAKLNGIAYVSWSENGIDILEMYCWLRGNHGRN